MKSLAIGAVILLAGTCGISGESPQLTGARTRVLESVRDSALAYTRKLPDFICTQITHRSVSNPDAFTGLGMSGRTPIPSSTLDPEANEPGRAIEERVTFYDQKETYQVVSVDGRKVSGVDPMQFEGATSAGEFGTALHDLFDPHSHTVFRWQKTARLRGRRVLVFGFRVPVEGGAVLVHKNPDRQIVVPYSGQIYVDAETLDVLRIQSQLEIPSDFPMQSAERVVDYKPIEIAGKPYVLPFHSEMHLRDNLYLYVNSIDFRNYHKFAVESKIEEAAH